MILLLNYSKLIIKILNQIYRNPELCLSSNTNFTMYNEFQPLPKCNNPKPEINGFISLTDIDYPINIRERTFLPRKRTFIDSINLR